MDTAEGDGSQDQAKPQDTTEPTSSQSEAAEEKSLKRKLDDEAEIEENLSSKRVKVNEEEQEEEDKDKAPEEAKKEEDSEKEQKEEGEGSEVTVKKEEAAPEDQAKDGGSDGGDSGSTSCEAAESLTKDAVKMEVEETQPENSKAEVKEDKPGDTAEDKEEVKPKEEPAEEAEPTATMEVEQQGSDGTSPKPDAEKDDKADSSQRRYPTRHRGGENKESKISSSEDSSARATPRDKSREKGGADSKRASSIKSDSGSDKENVNGETAMDLSNAGTPDVIMLSDEEETAEHRKESEQQVAEMRKLVRHLQCQLRNEEAKLVLLKKLRQSQLTPQISDHPAVPGSGASNQLSKQNLPRQQGGPPPLVRGGQQNRSSLHMQQQQQQGRPVSQGPVRNMQGPPPLVGVARGGTNNANGHSSQGMRSSQHLSQHGSSHRPGQQQQQQQQQAAQHQQAATPPQPPVDTQTPAQRQAAAKLALRKQLEKTLLQIPPPKPPAPEMNFIPSLACQDFVLLLGLEEVVNHIIDLQLIARGQKSPDEKFICNPFTCVQCGTDYTPVWKREKPGSKNVICEHCVTWNQKRALKQEHTNRLKSAFVKALQQEQEIERMQAQTPSNSSTPTPNSSATPPSTLSSTPSLAAAAAASNVAAAAAMTMSPASFRPSAEQVRQHHSFLQQAHQAQMRAGQPLANLQGFGSRNPFPYSLPYVKQADLQRQYLLDMIPRAGMPWKP